MQAFVCRCLNSKVYTHSVLPYIQCSSAYVADQMYSVV